MIFQMELSGEGYRGRRPNAGGPYKTSEKLRRKGRRANSGETGAGEGDPNHDCGQENDGIEESDGGHLRWRRFVASHGVLYLGSHIDGDEVIGHGDDGEEKCQEKKERNDGAPLELLVGGTL